MSVAAAGRGRPLRFLVALGIGWVGVRVAMLWPVAVAPVIGQPPALALGSPSFLPAALTPMAFAAPRSAVSQPAAALLRPPPIDRRARTPAPNPTRVALALLGLVRFGEPAPDPPAPILPGVPRPQQTPPVVAESRGPSRWSGSFWLVARGDAGGAIAPGSLGGQLGGSQAGLRLAYLLDRRHRVALAVRATTPLGAGQRELAAGVEWQPTRLPLRIVAEQRVVVAGGGKGGPALGVVGGLGPKRLGGGVTLEAYGQAGVIRRERTERYVDGAAHLAHKLLDLGGAKLDIGTGIWGGAQRGAARLDVGPTLALTLPVAHKSVRLSLDWRERIAGQARPGSGLAVTLGTDF